MLTEELISIIVPIYDVKEYVEQCICSILEQTYHNLEIILIDDGSTDGSGEVCEQYAKLDSRVKVYHKTNGGLSDARNYGLDIATGDCLAFVDGDDWVHPQMYEIMLSIMHNEQADLVTCGYERENVFFRDEVIDEKEIRYKILSKEQAMLDIPMVVAWNKLYRKEIFKKIRYPFGRFHEDEFVIHEILWECEKIVVVDKAMYFYTLRDNSIVARLTPKRIEDALAALESRVHFANNHQLDNVLKMAIKGYCDYAINRYYDIKKGKEKLGTEWLKRLWITERDILKIYDNIELPVQYKLFAKAPRYYERWSRNEKRKERLLRLMNGMKRISIYGSWIFKR